MYDVEFGEVRLGQMGFGWVRCGLIGSGGVISHTDTVHDVSLHADRRRRSDYVTAFYLAAIFLSRTRARGHVTHDIT